VGRKGIWKVKKLIEVEKIEGLGKYVEVCGGEVRG
jgi:hypothetical protein